MSRPYKKGGGRGGGGRKGKAPPTQQTLGSYFSIPEKRYRGRVSRSGKRIVSDKYKVTYLGTLTQCIYTPSGYDIQKEFQGPDLKIAAFDMDQTVIVPRGPNPYPRGPTDWKFRKEKFVLRRFQELQEKGYFVVLFTNQGGITKAGVKLSDITEKIDAISHSLDMCLHSYIAAG